MSQFSSMDGPPRDPENIGKGKDDAVAAQGHPGGYSKETAKQLSLKLGLAKQATETEPAVICP